MASEKSPKEKFIDALATMPSEALQWVAVAVNDTIFPSGIGGFQAESQKAIRRARTAASTYLDTIEL